MITKAIVQSINPPGNRCIVRMPLFEMAASSNPVEAEALVNIAPGMFNSLEVGDVVFVAFEENAAEKPIILGKLFRGADIESNIRGGGGILNSLKVNSDAALPAADTLFVFQPGEQDTYKDLKTPKKIADYIKWLESLTKKLFIQQEEHFRCLKNWTQWQLKAENVEIDDGDLDESTPATPCLYQEEGKECKICGTDCPKKSSRTYLKLPTDKTYPNM